MQDQTGSLKNATSSKKTELLSVPVDKDIEKRKQRILARRSSSSYALVDKNQSQDDQKKKS
jgi:hypothetical protein